MGMNLEVTTEMLGRTPVTLKALLGGLPGERTACGGDEGDWGPFDVVGHLIFGEETDWIPRARMILEYGDSRPFVPFDRLAQFEKFQGALDGRAAGDVRGGSRGERAYATGDGNYA